MDDNEIRALGRRLARAQERLDAVKEEARELVQREVPAGRRTESELHRMLGVNRMTIRGWLGKRPPRKPPEPVDAHTAPSV